MPPEIVPSANSASISRAVRSVSNTPALSSTKRDLNSNSVNTVDAAALTLSQPQDLPSLLAPVTGLSKATLAWVLGLVVGGALIGWALSKPEGRSGNAVLGGLGVGAVIVGVWGNQLFGEEGIFALYEIVPGFLGNLIVAVVGDVIQAIGEGCSTATLELLGGQNALIDALSNVARETGKPFVVVLVSSKPQVLPASVIGTNGVIVDETPAEGTSALLWAPSPGMKGGQAIAEIILGETEPSGRLPITFPRHAGQLPVYYNQIRGQHGNRYADLTQNPAFAFGEGLSYTTFEYGDPTITNVPESGIFTETDTVHAEITLTNTGDRKGTEVVQLYIGDIVTSYSWTDRELKAFQRVELEPGKSKTVAFDIPVSDCTIVDSEANRIVEPGEFEVLIGHSSRREHLKRTTFTVA